MKTPDEKAILADWSTSNTSISAAPNKDEYLHYRKKKKFHEGLKVNHLNTASDTYDDETAVIKTSHKVRPNDNVVNCDTNLSITSPTILTNKPMVDVQINMNDIEKSIQDAVNMQINKSMIKEKPTIRDTIILNWET